MLINYETLKAAFEGFKALYQQGLIQVQPQWPKVAMKMLSTGYQETYEWLGDVPQMVKWLAERQVKQLTGNKYTLTNEDYEATVGVLRNHFLDDKLAIYNVRIQDLPFAYTRGCDRLVFELLKNGFAALGPDGQYFFDNDHAESGTNQSNLATTAYSKENIETGFAAMMNFTSDSGEYLGVIPNILVVPPALYLQALRDVGSSQLIVSALGSTSGVALVGGQNPLANFGIEVIPSPYVGSNDWFWLCTKYPVKPLIMQVRQEPEFNALMDPKSSDSVFSQKIFKFGIDARLAAGYGLWQLAYGSTGGS